MDTFNGLLGLCSAAAVPPAVGTLGAIYEQPSKGRIMLCMFQCWQCLGFCFGSILSGAATKLFNWRASFWLLAIIYLIFTVVAIFAVPKDQDEPEKLGWEALKKFDILGTLCTIAGIALFSSSLR
jgi:MFS family permease